MLQYLSPYDKNLNTTSLPLDLPNPWIHHCNQFSGSISTRLGNRLPSGLDLLLRSYSWLLGYHHPFHMHQYAEILHGQFHPKHHHGRNYLGTPNGKSLVPADV